MAFQSLWPVPQLSRSSLQVSHLPSLSVLPTVSPVTTMSKAIPTFSQCPKSWALASKGECYGFQAWSDQLNFVVL